MYVLYLDASGTPDLQDSSKHYVLVGLCMHEGSWFGLDRRLQELKRNYCLEGTDPDQLEIHVKEFAGTINEQDEISNFEQMPRRERRARVLELQEKRFSLRNRRRAERNEKNATSRLRRTFI